MKPAQPLISCIMPTRNRGHFVAQSVRFFQRQDWDHRELIIIDDGREGRSSDFCRNKRIRYVHKSEPLTIGAKRNLACELAQGSIIAHWDDDDWYSADRLSIQAAPLVQELAARGASLDSREKGLCNSQRRFVECGHGDGPKREAATARTALDCAHGVAPDGRASFL